MLVMAEYTWPSTDLLEGFLHQHGAGGQRLCSAGKKGFTSYTLFTCHMPLLEHHRLLCIIRVTITH